MRGADVIIIGGGIAGLGAASRLARRRPGRIVLLEREAMLGMHASGRNAAIYRRACPAPLDVALAVQSAPLLDDLFDGRRDGWLSETGALYPSSDRSLLERVAHVSRQFDVEVEWLERDEFSKRAPHTQGGAATVALAVPADGVLDANAILHALARQARAQGVRIETNVRVNSLLHAGDRVTGVERADGTTLSAGEVIIASGAWAAELGNTCGAPLPLTPLRRHLVLLHHGSQGSSRGPVVWHLGDELYSRPESSGVLASPCDEEAWPAGIPPTSGAALELLFQKLSRLSPHLARSEVVRQWACLRTFVPDRLPVVGPDPRLRGLWWLGGFGGHGMSGALAAAEVLAAKLAGRDDALGESLSVTRLLSPAQESCRPGAEEMRMGRA